LFFNKISKKYTPYTKQRRKEEECIYFSKKQKNKTKHM